jgi:hypothetical protein
MMLSKFDCRLVSWSTLMTTKADFSSLTRDKMGDKPWEDGAANAQWSFWNAADEWLPTWGEGDKRGMTVRSVKMWQKGACGGQTELK